jgi:glycosyltransferase-like protein
MQPLRIALLTYSTKPRGGVVHTLSLAEELAAFGHLVHVYALSAGEGFFRPVTLPHTLIPYAVKESASMDERVRARIAAYIEHLAASKLRFDLYHAQDCISANALCELRCRGAVEFFVRTVHHVDDFTSPSLVECQLRSIVEPDHIIVVSKLWEEELRSRYGVDPVLIHNGVNIGRLALRSGEADQGAPRMVFGSNGCRAMLSIGGIEPRKNTLSTLRAFNAARIRLASNGERLIWLLAGGMTLFDYTDYRDQFFEQLARFGLVLGEDVRLLGNVPEDALAALYRAADVFVFPSVKEGWGLVVLEALACGLPVIASKMPPMTEYLEDGSNALLVDPTDHEALAHLIVKVLATPELREKLIARGRETARSFSWTRAARDHAEFYARILRHHATGRAI